MEAIIYDWLFGDKEMADRAPTLLRHSRPPSMPRPPTLDFMSSRPPPPHAYERSLSHLDVGASAFSLPPPQPRNAPPPTPNYASFERRSVPIKTFGGEGSEDGQLSRPWGICCDKRGRVLVADRSNNRIQIFTPDGVFVSKFGTHGSRAGQLNRPAGLCINSLNQIIVADKDNHRIQVFDEKGTFSFMFGGAGRAPGQFNYPWGVACNAANDIAVSDTRNHRVQIFDMFGQFLRKCSFDAGLAGKNVYSPRGLVYLPDGCLVVTDFNGHRVAVLDMSKLIIDVAFYGAEGQKPGLFCRPQGVALDHAGNILVCDSRCNRVQVFNPSRMRVLAVLGVDQPFRSTPTDVSAPRPLSMLTSSSLHGLSTSFAATPPTQSAPSFANSLAAPMHQPTPPFAAHKPPSTPSNRTSSSSAHSAQSAQSASGEGSSANGESFFMDRPSDVTVGLDGRVYVVDFGNHCVHIF